ncbi:unnamed protein product [Sphacelaria rigidula]
MQVSANRMIYILFLVCTGSQLKHRGSTDLLIQSVLSLKNKSLFAYWFLRRNSQTQQPNFMCYLALCNSIHEGYSLLKGEFAHRAQLYRTKQHPVAPHKVKYRHTLLAAREKHAAQNQARRMSNSFHLTLMLVCTYRQLLNT